VTAPSVLRKDREAPFRDDADDAALLAPWIAAYEAFYGRAPVLQTEASGFATLAFQKEDDRYRLFQRMVGTLSRFANKPRMLEHLRRLGYAWDDRGLLLTIPTPASFVRRTQDLGLGDGGVVPRIVPLEALDIPAGTWLLDLTGGQAAIQVGTPRFYDRALPGLRAARAGDGGLWPGRAAWIHHLLAPLHDMTKHVLSLHLVPRTSLFELGGRVLAAIGPLRRKLAHGRLWTRAAELLPKAVYAPVPLLTFYENDLVDYCHRVWEACSKPEEFAPTFTRGAHYAQLEDVLERRLRQSREWALPRAPPRVYARFEIDRPS
jgi:hypothetical protein